MSPGVILVGLVFGSTCALLASGKQRSPVGWFVIGALLPLIGLILIIVLPRGDAMDLSYGEPPTRRRLSEQPWDTPEDAKPAALNGSIDALQKLADLRDRGALTDLEFEAKKKELLSGQ